MALTVGAAAPDFTLRDQSQKEVKLSDYQGKKNVVVVFYPLDWSPICTNEHVCFVNDMKNFEKLDAQVLGISVDSVWSHKAFAEKMGIHYPLLADFQPRGAVGDKFGVYLADKGITGRAIAIIDQVRKSGLVQELRHSHLAGPEGSFRRARTSEVAAPQFRENAVQTDFASNCGVRFVFGEGGKRRCTLGLLDEGADVVDQMPALFVAHRSPKRRHRFVAFRDHPK